MKLKLIKPNSKIPNLSIRQNSFMVATVVLKLRRSKLIHGLHYSVSEDGEYCKACVLFAPTEVKHNKSLDY